MKSIFIMTVLAVSVSLGCFAGKDSKLIVSDGYDSELTPLDELCNMIENCKRNEFITQDDLKLFEHYLSKIEDNQLRFSFADKIRELKVSLFSV